MRTMWRLSGGVAVLGLGAAAGLGCAGSHAVGQGLPRASMAATAGAGAGVNEGASAGPHDAMIDEERDATTGLLEHHRHHHHGGVTLLLAMSLDTLGVSPEQKEAMEKIRRDLHAQMEPARAAEQNLAITLADGLAVGAIDTVRIDAAVGQLSSAAAAVNDASADAMNQVHAILTPPQRVALVEKLEAHWSVWQKANRQDDDHLAQLAAELGLAPDQVERIRTTLPEAMKGVAPFDAQEVSAHLDAFANAFEAKTFDARALARGGAATTHMVGWGGATMAHFIEAVSPVLTAEQRTKLAQQLRHHANHNPSAEGG